MKKLIILTITLFTVFSLAACTQVSVTCGEGTIIKDGKCVAPDVVDNPEDPTDPVDPGDNNSVSCDSITGEVFYEANFSNLESVLVDNEPGNLHNANNFVVWGQTDNGTVLSETSVQSGSLVLNNLAGDQLDSYYNSGLGYQFFDFITDTTYTVCTELEGPSGQTVTSEIGIYYGYGTKDEVLLTGDKQVVIQDFMPTLSTNNDHGQYVIFIGNVSGEVKIHSIKIVQNNNN